MLPENSLSSCAESSSDFGEVGTALYLSHGFLSVPRPKATRHGRTSIPPPIEELASVLTLESFDPRPGKLNHQQIHR